MKQFLLIMAALVTISVAAQAQYDSNQVRRVGSLPATCTAGTTNAVVYSGVVYQCTSTNTWTAAGTDSTKLPLAGGTMTGPIVGLKDKGGQVFNVKAYGAVGDGSTHPLSGTYGSVAAAAAVYPFVGTVHYIKVTDPGKDYASAPSVAFSSGSAVAHAVVADQQVSRVNLTSGGSGYNVPPKVTFSGGVCTYYPKADAIVSGGAVTSVIVKYGGLSCASVPTVTIAAPLSTQATATFTVSGGVPVSPVTMTNIGLGYTTGSTASISGCGVAPTLTVNTSAGRITSITSSGGSGCSAGSVTISAPNGAQSTATADVNGLLGIVITNAGSGYTSAPGITISGGSGTGAAATAYVPLLTDELDWAAAQLAVNSLDSTYGGTVLFPTGKYKISQPIKLSEGNGGGVATFRTIIRGEGGAYLLASTAIDIIQRVWQGASTDAAYVGVTVPSQRIAQANNWEISGLYFRGPSASVAGDGSHAINIDCTYNLSLHHLYVEGFDTGIENNFGLMTSLEFSQFRNSETADFVGKRILDSFATNSFMARRNRHQSDQQSAAAIRIWGGSGAKIQDSIFEAYSPRITIDADALGYSTATDVTIRGIHLESDYAYSPPYTFAHVATGGRAIIDDIFPQEGDDDGPLTLVDASDIIGGGASVLVSNVSNIPSYLRFRGLAYTGIGWQMRNVGTIDWNSPASNHAWDTTDGAAKPGHLLVESVMVGTTNTKISKESFEKLAAGNDPNTERFRVSQNNDGTYYPGTFTLDNIAAFHVDDSGGYNQSWYNDTYGASAAGRVRVDNSGNVDLSAVADKNFTLSTNGTVRATIAASGITFVPTIAVANAAITNQTGSVSLDLSTGNIRTITFGAGNITSLTATNVPVGFITIALIQDGTGSRTVTWNSLFKWAGGTTPTLSTAANARDQFSFQCDGTSCYILSIVYDVK